MNVQSVCHPARAKLDVDGSSYLHQAMHGGHPLLTACLGVRPAGHSVARYIANPAPCNTQIVALGVDAYLKMLLHDNFVHTDLHPGNILVRQRLPKRPGRDARPQPQAGAGAVPQQKQPLQLVLLDFGLAEELNFTVRRHFISLLHMISKGAHRHLPCTAWLGFLLSSAASVQAHAPADVHAISATSHNSGLTFVVCKTAAIRLLPLHVSRYSMLVAALVTPQAAFQSRW